MDSCSMGGHGLGSMGAHRQCWWLDGLHRLQRAPVEVFALVGRGDGRYHEGGDGHWRRRPVASTVGGRLGMEVRHQEGAVGVATAAHKGNSRQRMERA